MEIKGFVVELSSAMMEIFWVLSVEKNSSIFGGEEVNVYGIGCVSGLLCGHL